MACYQARKKSSEDLSPEEVIIDGSNPYVRYFMNQSMQAIETMRTREDDYCYDMINQELVDKALKACLECDFSKPRIAEFIKPAVFSKESERRIRKK